MLSTQSLTLNYLKFIRLTFNLAHMYDFICPHARVLVFAMELFCMEKFDQLGTGFVEGVLSTFYTIIFASILMGS